MRRALFLAPLFAAGVFASVALGSGQGGKWVTSTSKTCSTVVSTIVTTVTGPGTTVTSPPVTVTTPGQTVTQTVHDVQTQTVVQTVTAPTVTTIQTQTQVQTVTRTLPARIVIRRVPRHWTPKQKCLLAGGVWANGTCGYRGKG